MASTFERVAPSFYVSSIDRAIEFWTKRLGFEVTFTNGNPVSFVIVRRDAVVVHLGVRPELAGKCHCHIMVKGIEELSRGLALNGTRMVQPLKKQSWGLQDIVIADPDGNTIEIAEPIAPPPAA